MKKFVITVASCTIFAFAAIFCLQMWGYSIHPTKSVKKEFRILVKNAGVEETKLSVIDSISKVATLNAKAIIHIKTQVSKSGKLFVRNSNLFEGVDPSFRPQDNTHSEIIETIKETAPEVSSYSDPLPLLDSVLTQFPKTTFLIEFIDEGADLLETIATIIEAHKDHVILAAENYRLLKFIRRLGSDVKTSAHKQDLLRAMIAGNFHIESFIDLPGEFYFDEFKLESESKHPRLLNELQRRGKVLVLKNIPQLPTKVLSNYYIETSHPYKTFLELSKKGIL